MTKLELAQKVLEMLDAQQKFFKSRSRLDLQASKKLESSLKAECQQILKEGDALAQQTRMFGTGGYQKG